MTKKGSLIWKIGRWVENVTYRAADKIIVISEDFIEVLDIEPESSFNDLFDIHPRWSIASIKDINSKLSKLITELENNCSNPFPNAFLLFSISFNNLLS